MREKFKSQKDAREERKTVDLLNQRLNPHFRVVHNETPNNHWDFDVYDAEGNHVSIMEFKRRYIHSEQYRTWVIAKVKLERLKRIAAEKSVKPIWVFGFDDVIKFTNINDLDKNDLGPVTEIRRDKPRRGGQRGVSDIEEGYKVRNNRKWKTIKREQPIIKGS